MHRGWTCLRATGTACVLDISVSPNARRTAADGLHDGALRVRLAAPPVDGKANEELRVLVAEHLGVRRAQVVIKSGAGGRLKLVQIHPA